AHGFTYSGHPLACAAALANLSILRGEKIVETVREDRGPYLQKLWHQLGEHPLVGETRMVGLIGALEITADKETRARFPAEAAAGTLCRDLVVKEGLVMRAVGDTMIIAPPLVLSHDEADELATKAQRALDLTLKELKSRGYV
ncbi:MAG: aminotransferase class III-fold pyridoxal phosphate-dependent enzyme, partial [Alphaproteobacteria bacterium]